MSDLGWGDTPATLADIHSFEQRLSEIERRLRSHRDQHEVGGFDGVRLHVRDDGTDTTGRYRTLNFLAPLTVAIDQVNREYEIALTVGALDAGTYTPTLTGVANVDSAATDYGTFQYLRVGSVVTVSGLINLDPTAAGSTQTQLGISLPLASNFSAAGQCGGTGADWNTAQAGQIYADITNDRAELIFKATATSNQSWSIHFTYRVV